ncbi:MAG: FtsX-like permease family protein [Bacteroidia bacterium]|nr:FtsX-like permease family protein [Bacteroidia bacterium]MCF8425348.1 FtsX-like permease family protein [Bacteroidia bacterium]MCF8446869.1 FtsX-like permease family protein [Bacteroidia bacterium]
MKVSFFIAKRLMAQKPFQRNGKGSGFSKLIINLAMAAVCVSVMVMILATAIVKGYQHQVRDKLIGFNAPIQVSHLDLNNSFESLPIERDSIFEHLVARMDGIKFIQSYSTKAGIIKTEEAFEGIVLKGIGSNYNWDFISKHLVQGSLPNLSDSLPVNEVLISSITANRLGFKLEDNVFIYFIQNPPRVRKLKIVGIFDTGMGELDELYAYIDIRQVQKLNNWDISQISGYEIGLNQIEETNNKRNELAMITPYNMGLNSIFERYPALFDWLNLLDLNVVIILLLMVAVAAINMITALLILILERTQMIGLLKAMGAEDRQINKVFLWMASSIILRGLLLGNALGIGFALLQDKFGIIKLDQKAYYLNQVPVEINLLDLLNINFFAFVICLVILVIPVRLVSKVNPVKSIQFT